MNPFAAVKSIKLKTKTMVLTIGLIIVAAAACADTEEPVDFGG